jgi:hypothetical protein
MITIKTPDGVPYCFTTREAATDFVTGFVAALQCFGIYRNGEQVIGCMEEPISGYRREMIAQLGVEEINQAGKES